jgi:peptide/nickel transport system substrate-binding protein
MVEVRRFFGLSALIVALAVVATGCSSGREQGQQGTPQPAAEQRLVVGSLEDGYTSSPGPESDVGQYPLNANIFEGLVQMDADYGIVPVLATEWEFQAPNTWRFTLREGVQFHDGQPFNAEAVKYAFDRVAKTGGGTPGFGKRSTKVIDEYTVEVTPVFDNKRMIEQLVHPQYSIVAPGTDPADEPVGTGPFRFVSYTRQDSLVVERFDEYWGTKAELEQITFRFIPDPNARRLALEAGEVDMAIDVPREAVADLTAKGFVVETSAPGAYEAMYANISGEKGYTILQDQAVRQAIAYAIDRDALVQGVFEDLAAPEQTMIPSRLLGDAASQVEGFAYDPDQARQLLDDAGWVPGSDEIREKDGQRLSLVLVNGFPSSQTHGSVPEFLQDQLRDVGIEVEIAKTPDTASYEDRLAQGEGDLWLESGSQNDANPAFLPALLFWSVGLFGDIGYQPLFAPGGEFDDLIVDALASPDAQEVKDLMGEAMHVLIDQEAVVIAMAGIFRINALSDRVQGFEPHPSGLQVSYNGVFLSE